MAMLRMVMRRIGIALAVLVAAGAALPGATPAQTLMNGAGATFPYPIY